MATDVLAPTDDPEPDAADPAEPTENEAENGNTPDGMPPQPKPLGMMVAFLPSDIELDEIEVPGGLDGNDLHLTLRYYGEVTDPAFIEQVHDAARTIAGNFPPFVANVTGRRQLGDGDPAADVLILGDHKAFRLALDRLPPSDKDYNAFTPHITVGYGIDDATMAQSTPDNLVMFDHIVVANGNDDWTPYLLGDIPPEALDDVNPDEYDDKLAEVQDQPLPPEDGPDPEPDDDNDETRRGVTAGISGVVKGKVGVGSRGGHGDPRPSGSKQKCFHGSPLTCKSVKWIAVYTALREKRGFSKSKAAAIANSMHNRWKKGEVGPRNHHPIIRKTI